MVRPFWKVEVFRRILLATASQTQQSQNGEAAEREAVWFGHLRYRKIVEDAKAEFWLRRNGRKQIGKCQRKRAACFQSRIHGSVDSADLEIVDEE